MNVDALAGLKVLELGQLIAGPFAGKTLADFGADVIKIEPVEGGDPLRSWRLLREGTSVWWEVQSRNKRSVALDLRAASGQAAVRALAAEADVLIENFKPGTLEGWGLGWDALHAANPKLIMLRVSGYGQSGPYRDKPGCGGFLTEKKSRRGSSFYGCSNYSTTKCDFVSWDRPVLEVCPECNAPFLLRKQNRKGIKMHCASCTYVNDMTEGDMPELPEEAGEEAAEGEA